MVLEISGPQEDAARREGVAAGKTRTSREGLSAGRTLPSRDGVRRARTYSGSAVALPDAKRPSAWRRSSAFPFTSTLTSDHPVP